ncbi:MAG: inorganic diphosphatase [Alphaproteobacteria bacterium]|nr:inorganic diphosphatase [Alphaproteobacteria bacterium]
MNIDKLPIGDNPPEEVNVIIEIPSGVTGVKYEIDKDSGAILVDRFMTAAMYYPAHYGFIPHTLAEDGDPLDALVVCEWQVVPGAVLPARPIGVLIMEDEKGMDEKLVMVPADGLHPQYRDIKTTADLPQILLDQINHFFEHYKDLEKNKWVKIKDWADVDTAKRLIGECIERAKK